MTIWGAMAAGLQGFSEGQEAHRARTKQEAMQAAKMAFDAGDYDAAGKALSSLGINIDLTQAKQAQATRRFSSLQEMAKGAGDFAGAASFIPELTKAKGAILGQEMAGPKLIGTYGTTKAPAPMPTGAAPGFADGMGMEADPRFAQRFGDNSPVDVQTYDPSKPDFNNPANQKLITSLTQFAPPAPPKPQTFELPPGHSRYSVGADGRPVLDVTAPTVERPAPAPKEPPKGWVRQPDGTEVYTTLTPGTTKAPPARTPATGGAVAAADAKEWTKHIQDFQAEIGPYITSTTRTPEHNKKVGGVPNSYHVKGMAFDAVVPPAQKAAAIAWGKLRGMDVIDEGDHLHFEPLPGTRPVRQVPKKEAEKPKEVKPFDELRADKIVRNELGIRQGRRIPPSKQAEYNKQMAARKKAHESRGGVSEKDAFFNFLEKEM